MISLQHIKTNGGSLIRKFLYSLLLKGNKVRCNVCGNNFSKFLREKSNNRLNARCPNCGSLEADRILLFYLVDEVAGKKNKNKFLYFAPNQSIVKRLTQFNIETDTSHASYFNNLSDSAKEKILGGKYDVIIFVQLLQILKDEQAVFSELKRLLRTGGFVILMTLVNWDMDRTYEKPVTDEDKDRLKNLYSPGVERVYGSDIAKKLTKAGFEVETIDYAYQLGSAARDYYQLGDGNREMIFKCKKIKSKHGSN